MSYGGSGEARREVAGFTTENYRKSHTKLLYGGDRNVEEAVELQT